MTIDCSDCRSDCRWRLAHPLWLAASRKWEIGQYLSAQESAMFDRVTFAPDIMGGRACIRGMRIPVSVIVGQFAHGAPSRHRILTYFN